MKFNIKGLFTLLLMLVSVSVSSFVLVETQNVFTAFSVFSVFGLLIQMQSGVELPFAVLSCDLTNGLKRKCQNPSMGGVKRLYIFLCEDLTTEFFTYADAMTLGEYAGAIPQVAGKLGVECEAWYDSTKIEGEMKSGGGFTQGIEFKVLGYDKDIVKFMSQLYETPVNIIAQGNDNRLYYIGQKYVPMMFEAKYIIPEKGTARKEVTFMCKQDGFTTPMIPLAASVTFNVAPLV